MASMKISCSPVVELARIAFLNAWDAYRKRNGVRTAAFWRLGIEAPSDTESEELRRELYNSLLQNKFVAAHVPALLLLIQTRATEHSRFLWEETVMPLLAGVGDGQHSRINLLRPAFSNSVLHHALRGWLRQYERDLPYNPGSHFWFVHAVIGECALVRVSAKFASQYLDSMFAKGAMGDVVHEAAESQFDFLLSSCLRNGHLHSDEELSVRALKECLVESGIRIAKISRLMRNLTPPIQGWSIDEIIDLSRRMLAVDLSGLPKSAINVLEDRIGIGLNNLTLDQVLGLFKEYPNATLLVNGEKWSPSSEIGLPVAPAALHIGGHVRRVQLVDDLGRGAVEVVAAMWNGDTGWRETGNIYWRASKDCFEIKHPSRLRSKARPVLQVNDSLDSPTGWVWSGLDLHFNSSGNQSESRNGELYEHTSFRVHVHAWQSLDLSGKPTFYVSKFRIRHRGRGALRFYVQRTDGSQECLWSGAANSDWISIRRPVTSVAGCVTVFKAEHIDINGEMNVATQNFTWHIPALFNRYRRVDPGEQITPAESCEFRLITVDPPSVTSADYSKEVVDGEPTKVNLYRIKYVASEKPVKIASSGTVWTIRSQKTPVTQLRLFQSDEQGVPSGLMLSDPLVRVFVGKAPSVKIVVHVSDSSAFSEDDAFKLISHFELSIGVDDELSPDCVTSINALRSFVSFFRGNNAIHFSFPLDRILPAKFLEASFIVQKIGLNCWLTEDEMPSANPNVMFERFVTLPYDFEEILPHTRAHPGSLVLKDSTETYDDLILKAADRETIPHPDCANPIQEEFEATFPFTDLKIKAYRDLWSIGIWFNRRQLTLEEFLVYCKSPAPALGICLLRPMQSVTVDVFGEGKSLCSTRTIEGPVSGEIRISNLISEHLIADARSQGDWFSNSQTRIVVTHNQQIIETLTVDLRMAVTEFKLKELIHGAAGDCTIRVLISAIPGYSTDKAVAIELLKSDSSQLIVEQRCVSWSFGSLKAESREVELVAPSTGDYELRVKRSSDESILRRLATSLSPVLDDSVDLGAFLDAFPDGSISLSNLERLYYIVVRTHEPWGIKRLTLKLGYALEQLAIDSDEYRLVDTLLAFLLGRKLPAVAIVSPNRVSVPYAFEVALIALQVQFASKQAYRRHLKEWADLLSKALEREENPVQKSWMQALRSLAVSLVNPHNLTTSQLPNIPNLDRKYACREDIFQALSRS